MSTAPAVCEDCKKPEELRPYGKGGAWVCFACAQKDPAEARARLEAAMAAAGPHVVIEVGKVPRAMTAAELAGEVPGLLIVKDERRSRR